MSIGDVSCQILDAEKLTVQDNVLVTGDVDERSHKANCERALTFLHQHYNCVVSLNMADKADTQQGQFPALSISNLEESVLEDHTEGLLFDQNTVPFDFDGHVLLWMAYLEGGIREIKTYQVDTRQIQTLIRFGRGDGIISHCKLAKPRR